MLQQHNTRTYRVLEQLTAIPKPSDTQEIVGTEYESLQGKLISNTLLGERQTERGGGKRKEPSRNLRFLLLKTLSAVAAV